MAERLAISGIPVEYPDFAGSGFRGTWSGDDWRRECDAILEHHGELDRDDALLMLCYATGLMPSDTEKPRQMTNGESAREEPNMLTPDTISQWKRTLIQLPSDSLMWDGEIRDFVEWLSNQAAEKVAARGVAIRWREVISEMSEPGPIFEQLNSVGVSAVSWADSEFDSAAAASNALETAEELKTVVENLVEHLAGDSNLGQVIESYKRIETLRAKLDAILASPRHPDDEPPKSKSAASESNGDSNAPLDISGAAATGSVQDAGGAVGLEEGASGASVPDSEDALSENNGGVSESEFDVEEPGAPGKTVAPIEVPSAGAVDDANNDGVSESELDVEEPGETAAPIEASSAGAVDYANNGGETESPDEIGVALEAVEEGAESPGELETAMWKMAGEGDLSGAYWIARSLEARGRELPAPSHLFKAAQGARWLSPNSGAYVFDLSSVVADHDAPEKNDVQKLLGLAAALQASVVNPGTNLAAWLEAPENCPAIEGVVAPIREFKDFGYPAMPEEVRGQDGIEELQKTIGEASSDAREWLEASHALTHRYPPATAVFRNLCRDGGMVREMMSPVANDNRTHSKSVREIAEYLKRETSAVDVINKVHQSIAAGGSSWRMSPIVSHPRTWLVGKIQESADKALRWCALVERENESASRGNEWHMEHVSSLRNGIDANSGEAFAALNELRSDSRDAAASAAAGAVAMSLARLLAYLRLPLPENAASLDVPAVSEDMDAIAGSAPDNLNTAMGRRLIWTPAARIGDDCQPMPDRLVEIGRLLLENGRDPVSLGDALKRRVEDHQDYRFYDVMSAGLHEDCRADLEAIREKARKASVDALADHAESARHDLQQAMRDGILDFDTPEREIYNDQIRRFIDANVDDFQTVHEEIQAIQDTLGEMRDEKRAELSDQWNRLLDRASDRADIDERAMQTWETKFSQADSQREIRVMVLCATRVGNYLNSDEPLLPPADDSAPHSAFGEFKSFLGGAPEPRERARGSSALKALINS